MRPIGNTVPTNILGALGVDRRRYNESKLERAILTRMDCYSMRVFKELHKKATSKCRWGWRNDVLGYGQRVLRIADTAKNSCKRQRVRFLVTH